MTIFVVCTIAIGPVIGMLTMRHPMRRSWLLLGIIAANVTVWTVVLPCPARRRCGCWWCWSSCCPRTVPDRWWASTSPARPTRAPISASRRAWSTPAGFLATLLVLATMGMILTALGGFTPEAFRVAWLVQYPVWAFAVVAVLITRRKSRRLDAATRYRARGRCARCSRRPSSQCSRIPARAERIGPRCERDESYRAVASSGSVMDFAHPGLRRPGRPRATAEQPTTTGRAAPGCRPTPPIGPEDAAARRARHGRGNVTPDRSSNSRGGIDCPIRVASNNCRSRSGAVKRSMAPHTSTRRTPPNSR